MKVNNITIIKKIYDPHADGYLVLGKNKKNKSLKKYVVGWVSRHKPDSLKEHYEGTNKFFQDLHSAQTAFDTIIQSEQQSDHHLFTKDWQKNRVYKWEDTYILPYAKNLSKKDIKELIKKVAKDYKIKTPKIEWLKSNDNSYYDEDDHLVSLGARDDVTALHEMAHAVHEHMHDRDIVANHPPAFVWKLIELYNKYLELDMKYLITSAHHSDIIGDINVEEIIDPSPFTPIYGKHGLNK
jgi:hypothetical protein